MEPQLGQARTVGPLERGHDPVWLVGYVARREVGRRPGWSVVDVFALKGDRVKYVLERPDNVIEHFVITFDVINEGITAWAVENSIRQLEAARV